MSLLFCSYCFCYVHSHTWSSDESHSFLCLRVYSLGLPCCGTGTAWPLLTQGTWPSLPMTRSKLDCRSSSTSLAGETEAHVHAQRHTPCNAVSINDVWERGRETDREWQKEGSRAAWHWYLPSIACLCTESWCHCLVLAHLDTHWPPSSYWSLWGYKL